MSERDDVTDPLEDGLRRLFHDDRLTISPSPSARAGIVAGARRVKRRRELAMAGGSTMAAVVAIAAGVVLATQPGDGGRSIAAPENTSSLHPAGPAKPSAPTSSSGKKTTGPKTTGSVDSGPPSGGGDVPPTEGSEPPPSGDNTAALPVDGTTIGPNGYGALTLGMSFADAQPYLADADQPLEECGQYSLAEGAGTVSTVSFTAAGTLVLITASGGRTPEGMGAGNSLDELRASYPEGRELESGEGFEADAASQAVYKFGLADGSAQSLYLSSNSQCG